ncbi:MAG: hypothetical protein AAF962_09300 [Actinomycetota bacterium]
MDGRRRRPRLAAATLVVAAIAASCGSGDEPATEADDVTAVSTDKRGDETTDDGTEGDGAPGATGLGDAVTLGRLEAGGGRGSGAVAGAAAVSEVIALGNDWFEYAEPFDPLPACLGSEPQAAVRRIFLNGQTGESAAISIDVYASEAEAVAALDELLGDYTPCLEAGFAAAQDKVAEQGIYDTVSADLIGQEPSLLDGGADATHRYIFEAVGPTSSLTLEATVTHYVVGQAVVGIEVALVGDRHEALTRSAASMVADELSWEPDPVVDEAVDRLRLAVLGPDTPGRFYQLVQPAAVRAPTDTQCAGPDAGIAELTGPVWATSQGISAIFQTGIAFADEAAAIDAMDALAATDPACVYGLISRRLAGTSSFDGGEITVETVDGREMIILDISMTQELEGSSVPVDVAGISVFVRVEADVVSWQFIGIRGDEPTMTDLAAMAADQLEARPS